MKHIPTFEQFVYENLNEGLDSASIKNILKEKPSATFIIGKKYFETPAVDTNVEAEYVETDGSIIVFRPIDKYATLTNLKAYGSIDKMQSALGLDDDEDLGLISRLFVVGSSLASSDILMNRGNVAKFVKVK